MGKQMLRGFLLLGFSSSLLLKKQPLIEAADMQLI